MKFSLNKKFRELIKNPYDTFNKTIFFQTRDRSVRVYARFDDGRMKVKQGVPDRSDLTLTFKDADVIRDLAGLTQDSLLDYLLTNKITFRGNTSYLLKLAYILTNFITLKREEEGGGMARSFLFGSPAKRCVERGRPFTLHSRRGSLASARCENVKYLEEPFLRRYGIGDFPGLEAGRRALFKQRPEVCTERARILTEYFMDSGFEYDRGGRRHIPILRQARALRHLLGSRKPVVREDSLLAGSTTSKKIGAVVYPEGHGLMVWPELRTISSRRCQPYEISEEDIELLDKKIFPFWYERNVREHARITNNAPRCQELDERFALYFLWKTVTFSNTIPDFSRALARGLSALIEEAGGREKAEGDPRRKAFYQAVATALEGVMAYAGNLRMEAARLAREAADGGRDPRPYRRMAAILERVPAQGARTLEEAVQSLWILWVALHAEITNAGLSLGRLDALLQPYFEADMGKLSGEGEREECVRRAVELTGDLLLKCQDHLPLFADVGNKLFGGSSSGQAVTLGGLDREGNSAVSDMTFIILKAAEMLALKEPNLSARYCPGVHSDAYLRRLLEVNLVTGALPSIHNDRAMIGALRANGFPLEDAREWAATSCVEPTIPGRHFGHTTSMMVNLAAPLEMALRDGWHPLLDEQVGPRTGDVRRDAFPSFEDFFGAFRRQLEFMLQQAVEYNNILGRTLQEIRPSPLLSSLFDGPMERGMGLMEGGALHNSSGVTCIGLADVASSLMTIKRLVYDDREVDLRTLRDALDADFRGHERLIEAIERKVPKLGSDHPEVNQLARQVIGAVHELLGSRVSYRGGRYLPGYCSMSNHLTFGKLTGASPSGRRSGTPLPPGIAPSADAGVDLLSSLRTVAGLDSEKMPNNISLGFRIAPDSRGSFEETVDQLTSHARSYFDQGGMQLELTLAGTETLRDALRSPEKHRNLLVRICGNCAYFVDLNPDLQQEIIDRKEFKV